MTTQSYIEENQMRRLKLEAEKKHLAVSELVRRAIKLFLTTRIRNIDWENDPINKTIGKIRLSISDASENHDYCLYGKKKGK